MKSILIIILLLSPILIFSYGWHIITVDNSDEVGGYSSIAMDSNDFPHIAYWDYNHFILKYAYFDGKNWNIENVDSLDVCGGISLALDSKDHSHISYVGYYNGELRYAYFDGIKWKIELVDGDASVGLNSLAIDSKDRPHISYYDGRPYKGDLRHAYFDGEKWNIEVVDSEGDVGSFNSIAVDTKDYIHISYNDDTNRSLKYAYFNGTKWNIETVYNNGNRIGRPNSIDVDSKDRPYIAYMTFGEDYDQLKFTYKLNGKWYIDIADESYFLIDPYSIKIDSNDYPHIVYLYYYFPDNSYIKYTYFDGNTWHYKSFEDEDGDCISLALDSHNYPHISYHLYPNLKYAWYEGPYPGIDLTSFSAMPNNDAITLNWSVSTDEDISGFNLYRRVVEPWVIHELPLQTPVGTDYNLSSNSTTAGEDDNPCPNDDTQWTKVNTSLITGTNLYSYTDRDVLSETAYEYKLEAVVSDKNDTLGTTQVTSGNGTPSSFEIVIIYPSPASSVINLDVSIPTSSDIDISIYDISGRKVGTVANGLYNSGEYTIEGDVSVITDGVYIVKMTSEELSASKRFVIAK